MPLMLRLKSQVWDEVVYGIEIGKSIEEFKIVKATEEELNYLKDNIDALLREKVEVM